jgi:hypothetical protein
MKLVLRAAESVSPYVPEIWRVNFTGSAPNPGDTITLGTPGMDAGTVLTVDAVVATLPDAFPDKNLHGTV